MAYEKQIEDFAESKATWVSSNQIPLLNTVQLVRGWKAVSDVEKATNEDYLNTYISPKNTIPSSTIEDPQADGCGDLEGGVLKNVFTGLWRHVSTAWSRENQLYLQTLRLGWASTLAADECMIKTGSDTRDDARSYTFYWRNIASTAVDACVAGLRGAGSLVNPLVQGETKAGTFAIADIVPEQQEDGSYWILAKTIKVATVASAGDLDGLEPVRKAVHVVENPFGLEGGYTAHIGRKPTDGILLTYRALSKDSQAVLEALTDAELQARLSTAEKLKYEFIKKDVTEDSGNTLTLALVYQYIPLATTITAESARYVGVTRKNQSNKIIVEISWPRIDPVHIGTISALALFTRDTVTDPVVEGITYAGEYFVNTTTAPMTDNDGIRIVQRMTKAGDQKLDLITGENPDHCVYEFFRWDISALDVAHFMAQTDDERYAHTGPVNWNWGTPEIGKTKNVQVQKNEDESFTLKAVYGDTDGLTKVQLCPVITGNVPFSGTPLTTQELHAKTSEKAFGWNIPVANLPVYAAYYKPTTPVVNQRNTFQISRQTEHVFDFSGTRETFVPVDSGWVTLDRDNYRTVKVRAGQFIEEVAPLGADPVNLGAAFDIPETAFNHKYERVFKKNELGSYDGQITHTEFSEYDDGGAVIEDTELRTVTRRVGKYLLATTVAPDFAMPPTARTIYQYEMKWNEVGTQDIVLTTILSKSALTTDQQINKLEVVETDADVAAAAEVTADAAAVNIDSIAQNAPNPDGTFKTAKKTSTLQPWESSDTVISNDGILEIKQKIRKNQVTALAAAANQEAKTADNDRSAYNQVILTRALASAASGSKSVHKSSVLDWDISKREVKTPTWNVTTNSDAAAYITGYNNWLVSMSRSRVITTTVIKSYTLTEPATMTVSAATAGGSEGEGTSYTKDAQKVGEGVWAVVEKTVATSAFSAYGNKSLTWINYISTMVGPGSC